jgi:hypothetical protein
MNLRGLEFEVCGQDSMGSGESKYGLMWTSGFHKNREFFDSWITVNFLWRPTMDLVRDILARQSIVLKLSHLTIKTHLEWCTNECQIERHSDASWIRVYSMRHGACILGGGGNHCMSISLPQSLWYVIADVSQMTAFVSHKATNVVHMYHYLTLCSLVSCYILFRVW